MHTLFFFPLWLPLWVNAATESEHPENKSERIVIIKKKKPSDVQPSPVTK